MDHEEEALICDIHTNIHLIRTYLKEFDDILSCLQRPPPPQFQKELLAFSDSLRQPIHKLSLLLEPDMGTTTSTQSSEGTPSNSSSSRSLESHANQKLARAPSLVHRNLDTIHCTNCNQSVPIHTFDKHTCPERRELTRLSSNSFSSFTHPHTDASPSSLSSSSSSSVSSDSVKSDPRQKSSSDPLPLPTALHGPLPVPSHEEVVDKKVSPPLDVSPQSSDAPNVHEPSKSLESKEQIEKKLSSEELVLLNPKSESPSDVSEEVSEIPFVNEKEAEAPSVNEVSKFPCTNEKESETPPVCAEDSSMSAHSDALLFIPVSNDSKAFDDAISSLNTLSSEDVKGKEAEEIVAILEEPLVPSDLRPLDTEISQQSFDAVALLSALENISCVSDPSNESGETYDSSSLLSALEGVSMASLDNIAKPSHNESSSHLDVSQQSSNEEISVDSEEDDALESVEPTASLPEDFNLSDLNSLSSIDPVSSQSSLSANDPDLMNALATLASFAEGIPAAQETSETFGQREEDSESFEVTKDEVLSALSELSHFSEIPFFPSDVTVDLNSSPLSPSESEPLPSSFSSIDIPAQSPFEGGISSEKIDKDSLMATLLSDAHPSFSTVNLESNNLSSFNKDDLLASLSVNTFDVGSVPFDSEEPQTTLPLPEAFDLSDLPSESTQIPSSASSSLKDDLLACLSFDSAAVGPIAESVSKSEKLSVSGLEDLASFGTFEQNSTFGKQEEPLPSSSNVEGNAYDLGSLHFGDVQMPSSSSSLKDDLLACLSLDTVSTGFGPVDANVAESETLSVRGLEDLTALTLPPNFLEPPISVNANEEFPSFPTSSGEVMNPAGSPPATVEEEEIASLPKQTLPPELEFANFLANPKKKPKNYAKIGRVGGRKAKGQSDMKHMLEEIAEGHEPPEFLAMFSPNAPISDSLAESESAVWKIAPRLPSDPLIRDLHCSDDTNVAGLRRAKKVNFAQEFGKKKKGKPVLMEDTHYVEYPFKGNDRFSLFSVFDGHVGHECAETARDNFHKILYNVMVCPLFTISSHFIHLFFFRFVQGGRTKQICGKFLLRLYLKWTRRSFETLNTKDAPPQPQSCGRWAMIGTSNPHALATLCRF